MNCARRARSWAGGHFVRAGAPHLSGKCGGWSGEGGGVKPGVASPPGAAGATAPESCWGASRRGDVKGVISGAERVDSNIRVRLVVA